MWNCGDSQRWADRSWLLDCPRNARYFINSDDLFMIKRAVMLHEAPHTATSSSLNRDLSTHVLAVMLRRTASSEGDRPGKAEVHL